ncbi:MAG TPA: UDP-N-acetylglucosamine 2-epimerase (non-hydrolyzing) [Candidatus Krumholzibacteria bacterium]|nr:UDP-N-acetylglucosamine 2-epimerase (non-hydrolyzing) [Candidatus Krumholzibacteria bacterium]
MIPERNPNIVLVAAARPNFMKVAPVWRALDATGGFKLTLVHTGQHYDDNMSKVFFDELGLPRPDAHLGVGSGSHAEQTARVMLAFEPVLVDADADMVIVVGDVNSTLACALVASKRGVPVAHVEAGLRSFDRTMPEEINRTLTDAISDLLFTTSPEAADHLLREGVDGGRIHFVGNVMIDSLRAFEMAAERSPVLRNLGLSPHHYGLVTLHRPSNVDDIVQLTALLDALAIVARECPLVFPLHPRTRERVERAGYEVRGAGMRLIDPVGYLDFLKLMKYSSIVLTDSGGIQEETTALGIPCLTIRENTERPITIEVGTNRLVGTAPARIIAEAQDVLRHGVKAARVPDLWDGKAAPRIAQEIVRFFNEQP